jgi:uncharacterized protein (TIGR03437 family)
VLNFLFPTNKMALVFATISCAFSQTAVIQGVGNAASGSSVVVPQMLVSIYGSNFASQTAFATGSPLPMQLGGASVTFNGIGAPLLYVSSRQINAQVPSGLQGSSSANVVVQTPMGASAAFPVTVTPMGIRDASPLITSFGSAPGIFTQDSSGCGQAAALNIHADGSTTLNTPQTSFDPQKDSGFAIFLTGLGYFPDRADGVPWSYNAADNRSIQFGATVGYIPGVNHVSTNLATSYAGPAPGLVGVDQVNAMYYYFGPVASGPPLPEGCRMSLLVVGSGTTALYSQLANVSIHSGGGACSDTPASSLGNATWQQNVTSDTGGVSTISSVGVEFLQGPGILGNLPPVVDVSSAEGYGNGIALPLPPFCAASYPATLDAGALTAARPGGGPVSLQPQNRNGVIGYQSPASAGALQAGDYSITDASGTTAVGPFAAEATLPAPITITTNLQPGTPVSLPFTLNWTGGGSDSVVSVQLNVIIPGQLSTPVLEATSPATAGTRTLTMPVPPASLFSMPAGAGVEILVTQQPAQAQAQVYPFSALGLTLGGDQLWKYVFDFKGLIVK